MGKGQWLPTDTRTTTNLITTMTTLTIEEHLNRILTKCKSLREEARKRTPGKWIQELECVWLYEGDELGAHCISDCHSQHTRGIQTSRNNAAFIASCAGPAEAGWEATIGAIEQWKSLYIYTDGFADGAPDASAHDKLCNEVAHIAKTAIQSIIAAWPEELLS